MKPGGLPPLPLHVKPHMSIIERMSQAVQEGIVGEGVPRGVARVLHRDPVGALDSSRRVRCKHNPRAPLRAVQNSTDCVAPIYLL
eukprot:scaffold9148_cov59-Phaeocystis_antarctica.AAC.3